MLKAFNEVLKINSVSMLEVVLEGLENTFEVGNRNFSSEGEN